MKRYRILLLWVLLLGIAVGAVFLFGRFETVEEHYDVHPDEIPEGSPAVYISIDCLTLEDQVDTLPERVKNVLPEGLVYLSETAFLYREGMTAFDLLLRAERLARLQIDYSGLPGAYYVRSINNLAEFSVGEESGWVVLVNGEWINRSSAAVTLSPGDVVTWRYTASYGDVLPAELIGD